MISILLMVVFGIAFGFFATHNTTPVTLQIGELVLTDVPLYLVAGGSLFIGLLVAWIFYFARTVSTSVTIFSKERETIKTKRTVADLEQKIAEIETINARLKLAGSVEPSFPLASSSARK
jgi:uncharacterized integral membrane protein